MIDRYFVPEPPPLDSGFRRNDGYAKVSVKGEEVLGSSQESCDGLSARQGAGAIARGEGERIEKMIELFEGDGSSSMWRYDGKPGGLADALRRAVEEGEISQHLAEMILDGVDGRGSGG